MGLQRKKLTVTVKRSLAAKDLVLADFVVKSIFMQNTETFRRYSDIYRAKHKSYGKFVVNYCLDPSHPSFFWLATLDKEVCSQLLGIALEYIDATNEAANNGVPQLLSQVVDGDFAALQTAIRSATGTGKHSANKRDLTANYDETRPAENQIVGDPAQQQIRHSESNHSVSDKVEEHLEEQLAFEEPVDVTENPILSRIPLI